MNSSKQAQKGFKTFILTLSFSLIIFSVIYYALNSTPTLTPQNSVASTEAEDVVLGATDAEEETTVFGELADQEFDIPTRTVLAGSGVGESTESTSAVPETGSVGITMGLVVSLMIFVVGLFVIYKDPRKMALLGFEKRVTRDL